MRFPWSSPIRAGVFAWPAQRTDGTNVDPSSIPEGAQLRLDPKLDIPALHLPPITQMMALAAQRYGIVVTNRTNSVIGFYAEDPNENGTADYSGGRTGTVLRVRWIVRRTMAGGLPALLPVVIAASRADEPDLDELTRSHRAGSG